MRRSRQSTASQDWDAPTDNSNTAFDTTFSPLKLDTEVRVHQMLNSSSAVSENGSQNDVMATANQPNFPDYGTDLSLRAPLFEDLFPPKKPAPRMATLHAIQEWEGYVVDIGDDEFVARLVDLTAGFSHATEEATIPFVEISDHDADTLTIGTIFRWVIGYERSPEGTKKRVSLIVFRDRRMTASDFREGEEWAAGVVQSLNL